MTLTTKDNMVSSISTDASPLKIWKSAIEPSSGARLHSTVRHPQLRSRRNDDDVDDAMGNKHLKPYELLTPKPPSLFTIRSVFSRDALALF